MSKCSKYYPSLLTSLNLCSDVLTLIDSYLLINPDIITKASEHYSEKLLISAIVHSSSRSTLKIPSDSLTDVITCLVVAHWRCGCDITVRFYNTNQHSFDITTIIRHSINSSWVRKPDMNELSDENGVNVTLVIRHGDPPKRLSSFPNDYIISWPGSIGDNWLLRVPKVYTVPKRKKLPCHPRKKRKTEVESLIL